MKAVIQRFTSTKGLPWQGSELDNEIAARVAPFAAKFAWFLQKGYQPHIWQILFHTMRRQAPNPALLHEHAFPVDRDAARALAQQPKFIDRLVRYRHLVAGRRGGKTLSAAWEVLFYCLHPEQFHWDAHGVQDNSPLWVWALSDNYKVGRPSLITFLKCTREAGLVAGKDFTYNKTEKVFEFPNGTLLEFKSADDPESLRGAGLDILWMDEAAFIRSQDAYNVVRPALSDKQGIVISTTTPKGKNWFYDLFWNSKALADPNVGSVEYRSIDNPFFLEEEWREAQRDYHPLMFKQEYLAMFDAMAGVELSGDWLHYYVLNDIPRLPGSKRPDLDVFMAVDPAISLADDADRFAIAVVGVAKDKSQVYLLDTFAGRIPFPEQIEKIAEWYQMWKPQIIGVEAQGYQRALIQQLERSVVHLPVLPIFNATRKTERILGMAPVFKIGKVKLHTRMNDFIEEWLNYDSTVKNPKDDVLDAVELALRCAGVLITRDTGPSQPAWLVGDAPTSSIHELARKDLHGLLDPAGYDEHMGGDW